MSPNRVRKNLKRKSEIRLREQKIRRVFEDPPKKPNRIGKVCECFLRWGIVLILCLMIIGGLSARKTSGEEAAALKAEIAQLDIERDGLAGEVEKFSDPEWRASYWKWRTMRHEPGEYYIDFVEDGIL
jgi:hypothetical protein